MSLSVPTVVLSGHGGEILLLFGVLLLGGAALVPVFVRLERHLEDEEDDEIALAAATGVETDPESGTVTLPDGTVLDRAEAASVEAVYDYFRRRPGATRGEVQRTCFSDHPAGFEDPDEWWRDLVDPAISAIAEANLGDEDDLLEDAGNGAVDGSNDWSGNGT